MEFRKKHEFSEKEIFSYDRDKKIISTITFATTLILIGGFIIYYLFALKYKEIFLIQMINAFFRHISSNIGNATLLGVFYGSLFGGLFFVIIPTEAIFISFLRAEHNPLLLLIIFLSGFLISYTLNYFIGMKLTNLSKMIITPKKFYSIKGILNRYGNLAIFAFNALPLPSQPLSTILGVFKYNKGKFYTFFMLGQLTKYLVIILASLII